MNLHPDEIGLAPSFQAPLAFVIPGGMGFSNPARQIYPEYQVARVDVFGGGKDASQGRLGGDGSEMGEEAEARGDEDAEAHSESHPRPARAPCACLGRAERVSRLHDGGADVMSPTGNRESLQHFRTRV